MKDFVETHSGKIKGVLNCFDRMLFRGYLPIQNGKEMAELLRGAGIRYQTIKSFLVEHGHRVKDHALRMAAKAGRPFTYLPRKVAMEVQARKIAAADRIERGLICIFTVLEPCRSFSFRFRHGMPFVDGARKKCLMIYFYFMDPRFGLIHVKLQTWFPMPVQVYVNGHEWLARKLAACGVGYTKVDNVFTHIADIPRAQRFADRFASLDWTRLLEAYARRVNPLLPTVLNGQSYYWVTAQSEYSTDILFCGRQPLQTLMPLLLSHSMRCFGAKEVLSFLGRKLHGQFEGEIVTDLIDLAHRRIHGARVKHRVKGNWIKMYDKAGIVLRIETVINDPEDFRVRKLVKRSGRTQAEWVQLRKGVSYLFRYRDISRTANGRYLDALAVVDDPSAKVKELDKITRSKRTSSRRSAKAFNPLCQHDLALFRAVMDGAHAIRGFTNKQLRQQLAGTVHLRRISDERRKSAKVSRILHRLHAHGLIAKLPHSRKWRTTRFGRRVMATAIQIRQLNFPQLLALAA